MEARMDTSGLVRTVKLGSATRAVLTGIAASVLIGVAACGSSVAGNAGSPVSAGASLSREPAAAVRASAGVRLCAAAQKVDRAEVSLTSAQPGSDFHKLLPRGITIRDVLAARALASALCALPPKPPGLHCPVEFAGAFRLVFAAGRRGFQPVRVQVSGCRSVTGVGPTRWWSFSPQLGRLLSQLLGGKGLLLIPSKQPSSVPTP
jgi:hypothetical protein